MRQIYIFSYIELAIKKREIKKVLVPRTAGIASLFPVQGSILFHLCTVLTAPDTICGAVKAPLGPGIAAHCPALQYKTLNIIIKNIFF